MPHEIRPATSDDAAAVRALALAHPCAEQRGYRVFKLDFASDLLAHQAERALRDPVCFAALAQDGAGFVCAQRLEWESRHFGLEMGAIGLLFAAGEGAERAERVAALLRRAEEESRARGLVHLALRLDVDDLTALAAAQRRGFRLVDTLVTYVHESDERSRPRDEEDPSFERITLRKEELARMPRDALAPLEQFMRSAYRIDRFHADLRLPAERSHEVYVEWFRKVFDGSWADGAQLIRKQGRIVGFCSFQHAREIEERYGVRIIGRGLAAVLPEGRGGYAVLTRMIHSRCPLGSRFQEFDSQIQNYPTIRVWIREGMPFQRGRYTLHRWLDE